MFLKIYFADISPLYDEKVYEAYYAEALEYRRKRADAYKLKKPKCRAVGAGILLKKALSDAGVSPTDADFKTLEGGKPVLAGDKGESLYFNLSHSGERAMCAVSDVPVGCDAEKVKDSRLVADRFFTEVEAVRAKESADSFTRLWTLKESFIKTTGEGLSRSLDSFELIFDKKGAVTGVKGDGIKDGAFSFYEWDYGDGYRYAACVQGPVLTPETEWVELT